jgi:ADP-ribose pyrophosphatase YjhB (NUDIX family)
MATIKKFNQFNTSEWIGPLKVLDIKENTVYTNFGNFFNKSENKLTVGYSYILRVVGNDIVDTGMSCVDLVVLVDTGSNYKVLSIKRGRPPFVGMWANPGGNIDEGEKPLDAAVRELEEETNLVIDPGHFYYVGAFDKPYRDPRNKNCVSHAFVIVLDEIPVVKAGDDATECTWNDVSYDGDVTVDMAFDHSEIIKKSIQSI